MINFDYFAKKYIKNHNRYWLEIPDLPYLILIIGGSGSRIRKALFNLIVHQSDTEKNYLYAKDLYEVKCQLLINKRENSGIKHFNDFKAFIENSINMDDIYKNFEEYNPNKKRKHDCIL